MLEVSQHDTIVEIRLSRAPVNALNPELIAAVRVALANARQHGARGIVLSGGEKVFSAGLDLPELLALERPAMQAFWTDFFALCADLACSPVPVVAAIGGHSPAGGAVLALMCDYRVMARGDYRIGLNETQVGLFVPECIQFTLRRLVGARAAERLLVAGRMLGPDEALGLGMVDELAPPTLVREHAIAWLQGVLALPAHAVGITRATARADLHAVWKDPGQLPVNDFLDLWFQPQAQAVLQQVVARLKGG